MQTFNIYKILWFGGGGDMVYWGSYIGYGIPLNDANQLMEQLKKCIGDLSDYIAWSLPTYLHLTLHYIGWISSIQSDIIKTELSKFSNMDISISSNVDYLGWNPKEKYIVIKVEKSKEIAYIHHIVKDSLKFYNIIVKEQDFIPHISFGRIHPDEFYRFNNTELSTHLKGIRQLRQLPLSLYESISNSNIL